MDYRPWTGSGCSRQYLFRIALHDSFASQRQLGVRLALEGRLPRKRCRGPREYYGLLQEPMANRGRKSVQ